MRAAKRGDMTRSALSMLLVSSLVVLAACGTSTSQSQQGSQTSGQNAVGSGQIVGGTASDNQGSADGMGDTYEGITCDDQNEGLAWCDDDYNIVYCDGGVWYSFDCAYLGDICVQYDDIVDCYDDFD
jgi:ABC-type oligopeptide transport system substrate-binding subunit